MNKHKIKVIIEILKKIKKNPQMDLNKYFNYQDFKTAFEEMQEISNYIKNDYLGLNNPIIVKKDNDNNFFN